mgnify:CR=1 FL=1
MVLLFTVSSLNTRLVLSFYCSLLRDFDLLVPNLHVAELVGDDPVRGVRHAHLDRPDGLVALDPRGEALVLLLGHSGDQVLGLGVV